ncbi:MAG: hypothetical protein HY318_06780, partial [Armatimonadetes bacterium]|nr:hypothetical protein [Armatimonadota bacterium]
RAQNEALAILSQARSHREYCDRLPQAQRVVDDIRDELKDGLLSFEDVAITRSLSRSPEMYRKANHTAIVAGELAKRGVQLRPGETVQYVVTDAKNKDVNSRARAYAEINADWTYDVKYYEEQLLVAAKEVLAVG